MMPELSSPDYRALSGALQERIRADRASGWQNPWRCGEETALRRRPSHGESLWRPAFTRDAETILHLPYYNRYADKTQVFSFYRNDDLSRRALHVQLVSRTARTIGAVLGLNLDLIEAIALGHDIGHTPFGHAGERFLDELLRERTGLRFQHNAQSVRVLDHLAPCNLTVQTLDGVLCHNGEMVCAEYRPTFRPSFETLQEQLTACETGDPRAPELLRPATLEGCLVRVCDMIAYLGKDRQDAERAHLVPKDYPYAQGSIGTFNAAMINNLTVDLIEHSYGRDCLSMSPEAYRDLRAAKDENYRVIYRSERVDEDYRTLVRPMFQEVYEALLGELRRGEGYIFRHHIEPVEAARKAKDYRTEQPDRIVCDYIASMTDDYFLDLHAQLFPDSPHRIRFHSYFEEV